MAGFKIGKEIGILSHGGMPLKFDDIDRKLTYPFGYNYQTFTNPKQSSLVDILINIESEKMALVAECIQLKDKPYNDNYPMIDKFVHLTASCEDKLFPQASSTYSPIIRTPKIDKINVIPDIKVKLSGGGFQSWINNDKHILPAVLADGNDIIHYNIFGHSPNYFNPIYNRQETTLHVNLDVSKIDEGLEDASSFAFLFITEKTTRLLGCIKFIEIDESNKTVNNINYTTEEVRNALSGKKYYYNIEIPKTGPVHLLKEDNIIGSKYKVSIDPKKRYDKLIS